MRYLKHVKLIEAENVGICELTIIGSNNGLSPDWHQAIIWTNVGVLLICNLGTNLSKNLRWLTPKIYDLLEKLQKYSLKYMNFIYVK